MSIDTTVGGETANSYASVAEADSYFTGFDGWDLSAEEKEQALTDACRALEIKYRGKWIGQKAGSAQALSWPRVVTMGQPTPLLIDVDGVPIPADAIPQAVKQAQLEVARIALTGGSFTTQPVTKDQFIKRKKVDVLETEWDTGKAPSQPSYPLIDQILFGLASAAGSGVPTVTMSLGLTDAERNQNSEYDPYNDPRYFLQG